MTASSSTPTTSKADDLPGLIAAFNSREELFADWRERNAPQTWTENWWFADAGTIEREGWNLSASRYRPKSREAGVHRNPRELLEELQEDVKFIWNVRQLIHRAGPCCHKEKHYVGRPVEITGVVVSGWILAQHRQLLKRRARRRSVSCFRCLAFESEVGSLLSTPEETTAPIW
jgi:hypothetical protein